MKPLFVFVYWKKQYDERDVFHWNGNVVESIREFTNHVYPEDYDFLRVYRLNSIQDFILLDNADKVE